MKSLLVYGPNDFSVQDYPYPKREKGEVVVRIAYSLMCSSDVKLLEGDYHGLRLPMVPGHEFSGIVVESDNDKLLGKKVIVDNLMPCGECEFCIKDKSNLCVNLKEIGSNEDGAFAQYLKVKEDNVFVLPDNVDLLSASIIEPIAVALHAVNRVPISSVETISVFGCGCIGLLIISILKYRGCKNIRALDFIAERLSVAKKLGASEIVDLTGCDSIEFINSLKKSDIVFDATGEPNTWNYILSIVKPGGKIGYVGYSGSKVTTFEPSMIMLKELNVYGVLSPFKTYEQALDYLSKGAINVNLLITHIVKLDSFDKIYEMMKYKKDGIIRAAFDFTGCCDN